MVAITVTGRVAAEISTEPSVAEALMDPEDFGSRHESLHRRSLHGTSHPHCCESHPRIGADLFGAFGFIGENLSNRGASGPEITRDQDTPNGVQRAFADPLYRLVKDEVLNETNRSEVTTNVIAWIDRAMRAASPR